MAKTNFFLCSGCFIPISFSMSWGVAVNSVWPDVTHCRAKITYWPRPKSSSQLQTLSVLHWAKGALWSLFGPLVSLDRDNRGPAVARRPPLRNSASPRSSAGKLPDWVLRILARQECHNRTVSCWQRICLFCMETTVTINSLVDLPGNRNCQIPEAAEGVLGNSVWT